MEINSNDTNKLEVESGDRIKLEIVEVKLKK
jgi:hypothetical protein